MLHPPDDFDVLTKLSLTGGKVNKNLVYWRAKDTSSNDLQQIVLTISLRYATISAWS